MMLELEPELEPELETELELLLLLEPVLVVVAVAERRFWQGGLVRRTDKFQLVTVLLYGS